MTVSAPGGATVGIRRTRIPVSHSQLTVESGLGDPGAARANTTDYRNADSARLASDSTHRGLWTRVYPGTGYRSGG